MRITVKHFEYVDTSGRYMETDLPKDLDVITVSIAENNGIYFKMFNCPVCKTPIFRYRGKLISIIPGEVPVEIPVVVRCSSRNCNQEYLIKTILKRVI